MSSCGCSCGCSCGSSDYGGGGEGYSSYGSSSSGDSPTLPSLYTLVIRWLWFGSSVGLLILYFILLSRGMFKHYELEYATAVLSYFLFFPFLAVLVLKLFTKY